ncbi:restriction endonuclease subunit S [Aliarcobacter butzleri]|uniref:restriction endonuclease subunit S n=1 Tax=Aliarcobacter butzleri TaxID=28197 RepID=UPI0021B21549|nr:restriction endonuclease subunit S [Aliarcobacter butzleri]MCT7553639.1 restriction endonuclease subunit S [Aliarcobacter butzleri]
MSKLLQFANFQELINWSVKTNLSSLIESKYKIVTLGNHIIEQKDKVKPFDFPEDDFKILGVSNKIGLFNNEIKKGKEINQAYKIVKDGYLAYNPYRINVGSIGIKTDEQKYDLISPAYVVFSCKETLLPEFLFLIFKTQTFNTIINESTRGSVRQILAFDILETLKIPLPTIEEQKEIVNKYHEKLNLSKEQELGASKKESEIEEYLYEMLGIKKNIATNDKNSNLQFINFKNMIHWGYDQIYTNSVFKSKYSIKTLDSSINFKKKPFVKKIYEKDFFEYVDISSIDPLLGIVSSQSIKLNEAPSRATQYINTGDLMIATTRPYLKKFAIVEEKYNDNICSSGFTVIEYSPNKYNLEYIKEFLQSYYGIEQMKEKMTGGLYPAITLKELKNIKIPFPDINIQNEIAYKIELLKNEIKLFNQQSEQNKDLAIQSFEREIFNEA